MIVNDVIDGHRLAWGGKAIARYLNQSEKWLRRQLERGKRPPPTFKIGSALVADIDDLAKRGVRGTNVFGMPTAEKLASLAGQVVAGTLTVQVQTFPLANAPEAMAAFSAGKNGKLVLEIA